MGIIDSQLEFSVKQSLIGTGTIVSTNVVDTGGPGDAGVGDTLRFVVQPNISLAGATAVVVNLQTDDNDAFSSARVLFTKSFTAAEFVAKATLVDIEIPAGAERYLRATYVLTGEASAGQVNAVLVEDVQRNRAYESGFEIV